MKKFDVTQYFWVLKTLVFLSLVWNTGFIQSVYNHSEKPVDQVQFKLATADSLILSGHQYGPWDYFQSVAGANVIWKDHGFEHWLSLVNEQQILLARFEQVARRGVCSREQIDQARDYYMPKDPAAAAIAEAEFRAGVVTWLWYQYLHGLPFALILFGVWFRENEYFQRFIRKPLVTVFSVVLWPVVLYLVFEDKFKSHYYSVLVEMALQRAKRLVKHLISFEPKQIYLPARLVWFEVHAEQYFHHEGRLLCGFVRIQEPVPWVR